MRKNRSQVYKTQKIIFPFAFLLLIISPCFLFTLKNKSDAEELKKCLIFLL